MDPILFLFLLAIGVAVFAVAWWFWEMADDLDDEEDYR